MTTGLGLITSAMRKIGALTKNESPTSDEANDGLEMLNDLLSSWSNNASNVYARVLESFTLTGNDGEYTIGVGANFNTARPIKIVSAYIRNGTTDYPVNPNITDEDFSRIGSKSSSGIPEYLNYDNGNPTATIKLFPIPSAAYTLFLLSEKELTSLTLAGTVSLPPGWKRAIIYNLGMDMAPEYGQPVTPELKQGADSSRAAIMKAVMRNRSMDVPRNLDNANNNIYTGWR